MDVFLLSKKKLTSFQIIILGFLGVILLGTILLMLPWSSKDGGGAPFLDALFTSTSAVCVTGLVLHDTATYWSMFGQLVILLLIQIGGMGVITVAAAFAMVSGPDAAQHHAGGHLCAEGRRHRSFDKLHHQNNAAV